ncbi:MAG TPA: HAD-IC family P-type ATPase, partial [Adhaeribacter sp.]|nr:HAD-IC family P-type ATPase [Adhaeribacter sp.]
ILLESGNKVPADVRLLKSNNLAAEEALLTGESVPVGKIPEKLTDESLPIGDKVNMLFAGTTIVTGRATGVITGTASETEIGKIATSLKEMETGKAPLVDRMEVFAKKISIVTLVACILLGGVGYASGIPLTDIFFFVVAVAVSAIPEGLPISMTVALSIGTSKMAKRHVIIRKLTAVEGLGSCTMIGTDKTGTITVDQQTVKVLMLPSGQTWKVEGEGYNGDGAVTSEDKNFTAGEVPELDEMVKAAALCNEGSLTFESNEWEHNGDPIDVAFLALPYKMDSSPTEIRGAVEIVKEIPFESERQYSAVYYKENGELKIAIKGAAERIVEKAAGADKEALLEAANKLASEGFRVIAVGGNTISDIPEEGIPDIKVLGLAALIDPLRAESKPAVALCHEAGVKVAMITGDHPATAFSIAQELGIADSKEELITGIELEQAFQAGEANFKETIAGKTVFSRVSPQQKQQIVLSMKDAGHFIAVTGDGVNDAPALKSANIGIAMGYGTDVAKETASIIISDNNFASIAAGIEEGRYTYSNLRKIIYLLISTGAAEILMIGLALAFQLPLPFLPVQLLWLNLVTNGIQDKALAFEAGEKEVMQLPPRDPKESVFNRIMIRQVVLAAATIALLTFGLWYHLLNHLGWEETTARNTVLLLMVLLQNFHTLNCRSETRSVFRMPLRNNLVLIPGILLAQGVHIAAMHIPFMQNLLQLEPVVWEDWLKLFGTACIIILVMEIFKWFSARRELKEVIDHN